MRRAHQLVFISMGRTGNCPGAPQGRTGPNTHWGETLWWPWRSPGAGSTPAGSQLGTSFQHHRIALLPVGCLVCSRQVSTAVPAATGAGELPGNLGAGYHRDAGNPAWGDGEENEEHP